METPTTTNQTNPASSSAQDKESQLSVINSSWETKSHTERAAVLEGLFTSEKTEIAFGTIEGEEYEAKSRISASKIAPKTKIETKPTKQVSEDYLQIMRVHYMKIILQSVRNIQPYAGTPSASIYIHKILHTIRNFEEKSPDDPILEVLFAFYDALAYQNQWTTYTSSQFEKAGQILDLVTKESIKSKDIEKAIAAFDNVGFDTIPFQFSLEDEEL